MDQEHKEHEEISYNLYDMRIHNLGIDAEESEKLRDIESADARYGRISDAIKKDSVLNDDDKTELCGKIYQKRLHLSNISLPGKYNNFKLPEEKMINDIQHLAQEQLGEKHSTFSEFHSNLNRKIEECYTYGAPDIAKLRMLHRAIGTGKIKVDETEGCLVSTERPNEVLLKKISSYMSNLIEEIKTDLKTRINKMQQVLSELIETKRISIEQAVTALRKQIGYMIMEANALLNPPQPEMGV